MYFNLCYEHILCVFFQPNCFEENEETEGFHLPFCFLAFLTKEVPGGC